MHLYIDQLISLFNNCDMKKTTRVILPIFKQLCCFAMFSVLACFYTDASAAHLLCSKPNTTSGFKNAKINSSDDFNVSGKLSKLNLMVEDVPSLFTIGSKSSDGRRTQICVYPASNTATKSLLRSMGLSESEFKQLLKSPTNSQHKVTVVNTEAEMLNCVSNNYPSVGYVADNESRGDLDCY